MPSLPYDVKKDNGPRCPTDNEYEDEVSTFLVLQWPKPSLGTLLFPLTIVWERALQYIIVDCCPRQLQAVAMTFLCDGPDLRHKLRHGRPVAHHRVSAQQPQDIDWLNLFQLSNFT